jgi:hypothetical protein
MRPPRLELDHVAPRRRTRWPGLALLGVSLAVAAGLAMRYQETAERLAQAPVKSFSPPPPRAAPARTNDAEERIARAALRQLALPWAGLVRALEDAAVPDVALLQVQPEAQQQVLRVSAQARNAAAMFRYIRGLTEAKGLSEVHLVSHEVAQDDPQHPVRFAAQASFRTMP